MVTDKKVVAPENMGKGLVWNGDTNKYDVVADGMELITTAVGTGTRPNTYALRVLASDGNYYQIAAGALRVDKPTFAVSGLREQGGGQVLPIHSGAAEPYGIPITFTLQNYNPETDLMTPENVSVQLTAPSGASPMRMPFRMDYAVNPDNVVVSLHSQTPITEESLQNSGFTSITISVLHRYSGATISVNKPLGIFEA